ncbi:MAG: lysoplasmalogenase [Burkholderiaceae bacterium]|nr:lysoplasmalogenase [Burkholderiaceae bacterium]
MTATAVAIEGASSASAWRRGAWLVSLAALAAIVGAAMRSREAIDGWTLLHWIGKPLATFTLVVLVARCSPQAPRSLRNAVVAGMACSLAGDVLLMLSPRLFVAGLVAFLVAHLCYLRAFRLDARWFGDRLALAVLAAIGASMLAVLWTSLPAALKAPVLTYVVVIVAMAAQAWARRRDHPSRATNAAAIGATLFVASDALLAIDRFRAPIPLASVWVLGTYWLAQWGIAQSVRYKM